ncbi:hypothetical protein ACW9YQ_27870 (plasmid) [Paraburkholderia strydomiana]
MLYAGLKSRLQKIEAKRKANVSRITSRVIRRNVTTGDMWIDGYVPKGAAVTGKFVLMPHFDSELAWQTAALEQQTALLKLATSRTNEPAESVGTIRSERERMELMHKLDSIFV